MHRKHALFLLSFGILEKKKGVLLNMANLCELKVLNKKNATLVVANRLMAPKARQTIPFNSIQQLEDAIAAERNDLIKIESDIPENVKATLPSFKFGKRKTSVKEALTNEEVVEELDKTKSDITEPLPVQLPEKEEEDKDVEVPQIEARGFDLEDPKTISRKEIIDMNATQMKKYVKDHNLEIDGYSRLKSRDLTNEILKKVGYDELTEDEVDR